MLPRVFVCETFLCAQGKILQGTSVTSVDSTLSLFAYKQDGKLQNQAKNSYCVGEMKTPQGFFPFT